MIIILISVLKKKNYNKSAKCSDAIEGLTMYINSAETEVNSDFCRICK